MVFSSVLFEGGMFVEDGEEGAFKKLPGLLDGRDEVESVPVYQ